MVAAISVLKWLNFLLSILTVVIFSANAIHIFIIYTDYYALKVKPTDLNPMTRPNYWSMIFFHGTSFGVILWSLHTTSLSICGDLKRGFVLGCSLYFYIFLTLAVTATQVTSQVFIQYYFGDQLAVRAAICMLCGTMMYRWNLAIAVDSIRTIILIAYLLKLRQESGDEWLHSDTNTPVAPISARSMIEFQHNNTLDDTQMQYKRGHFAQNNMLVMP